MENQELKKYLSDVVELESFIYKNGLVLEKLEDILSFQDTDEIDLREEKNCEFKPPQKKVIQKPQYEVYPKKSETKLYSDGAPFYLCCFLGIPAIVLGAILVTIGIFEEDVLVSGLVILGLGIALILNYVLRQKSEYEALCNFIDRKNSQNKEKYEKELESNEREYVNLFEQKQKECQINNKQITLINENKKIAREKLMELKKKTKDDIQDAKKKLEEFYNLDVVFPKYRNLVAVTTFYEYIASSRCEALEGSMGAYNLYENEIRQNVIIIQLKNIVSQLEDIKQNQYCVYQEMQKAGKQLNNMKNTLIDIHTAVSNSNDISKASKEISKYILNYTEGIKLDVDRIKNLKFLEYWKK